MVSFGDLLKTGREGKRRGCGTVCLSLEVVARHLRFSWRWTEVIRGVLVLRRWFLINIKSIIICEKSEWKESAFEGLLKSKVHLNKSINLVVGGMKVRVKRR